MLSLPSTVLSTTNTHDLDMVTHLERINNFLVNHHHQFTTSTTTSAADNKDRAWDRVGDGGDDEHYLYFGLTSAENRADALKEANCDFWDANPVPVGAVFGSPDEIN